MIQRIKFNLIGLIFNWKNNNYAWLYTLDKGYYRFEFFRSSIYSIAASVIILFLSKSDSLNLISWISLPIAIFFAIKSANKFTSIALILKEEQDKFSRNKSNKVSLPHFMRNGTVYKKEEIATYFRYGFLYSLFVILIVALSFLINKIFKDTSDNKNAMENSFRLKSIEDYDARNHQKVNLKIDTIEKTILKLEKKIDSLKAKNCKF